MTDQIDSKQNALDSIKRIAHEFEYAKKGESTALQFKGSLAWGWHAVGLLAYLKLSPGRESFDAWIRDYLQEGTPDLDIERDSRWEERERLSFLELIDLMSDDGLPSLKPEFYQGWQDRTSRCKWIREQVRSFVGASIGTENREKLLYLLAAYHRLVRLPVGVAMDVEPIIESYPALLDLFEMLCDRDSSEFEAILTEIQRCRKALEQLRS